MTFVVVSKAYWNARPPFKASGDRHAGLALRAGDLRSGAGAGLVGEGERRPGIRVDPGYKASTEGEPAVLGRIATAATAVVPDAI
jgi:hypothetical protein